MSYNLEENKTNRIDGSLSIAGKLTVFIQGMDISVDAGLLQRDSIGNGKSVFTQNGDIIGSFSFSLRNTTDLYDPSATPTLQETISFWISAISDFDPAIIQFIQTFNSPEGIGAKFARITFTGRIMKPATATSVDDALEDMVVEGEILTSPKPTALRNSS